MSAEHSNPINTGLPAIMSESGKGLEKLPPSLAVIPNIPLDQQSDAELYLEWRYWDRAVASSPGWASANAANNFRRCCASEIARRGLPTPVKGRMPPVDILPPTSDRELITQDGTRIPLATTLKVLSVALAFATLTLATGVASLVVAL